MEGIIIGIFLFFGGATLGSFLKSEPIKPTSAMVPELILQCKVACGHDRVKAFDNLSQYCECIDTKK